MAHNFVLIARKLHFEARNPCPNTEFIAILRKNSNFAEDMNKDEIKQKDMDNSPLKYKGEFEAVYLIIQSIKIK